MDLTNGHPIRRVIIASAIVLVLFGAGAATTFATADDGSRFTLPERYVGDRVLFEGDPQSMVAFDGVHDITVGQPRAWKDFDGNWHRADVLETSIGSITLLGQTMPLVLGSLVDGETWEPLAAAHAMTSGGSSSSNLLLGGGSSDSAVTWNLEEGITNHPCGVLNSLQGAQAWSKNIVVGGNCASGGPATFKFNHAATWEGAPAMVYEYDGPGPSNYGGVDGISMTFAAGLPYPVQVAYRFGDEVAFTSEFAGFERGHTPVRFPADLGANGPLPSVSLAQTDRYGPDLGSTDDVYPIEDVVANAALENQELSEFMARNPDWRIFQAQLDTADGVWWWLEFTGGDEELRLSIQANRVEDSGLPDLLGSGTGWTHSYQTRADTGRGAPALADMPKLAPAADDVAVAWQSYTGTSAQPNFVGFNYGSCTSFGCSTYTRVRVGNEPVMPEQTSSSPLGLQDPPQYWNGETFQLSYDDEAELEAVYLTRAEFESSGGPLAAPQPASQADNEASGVYLPTPPVVLGAVAGLFAALAYYFWPVLKFLPILNLFSRLRAPQLLAHPTRQQIMDAVEANPGIHFKQLQRTTGLANGTLRHHARYLVRGGLMQERAAGGFTCYFAGKTVAASAASAAPVLKSNGAKAVFQAIRRKPGLTIEDLIRSTGLSQGTIGYHLKRLREAGLVDGKRVRRAVHLELSADGKTIAAA